MGKIYMYGLVGRHIKINGMVFYGYKAYRTKEQANDVANEVRESPQGRLARVLPQSSGLTGYVVMVSKPKGERK